MLRAEPGGRMAGTEPGVDSTGAHAQRPAKSGRRQAQRARQANIKQKETEPGRAPAGRTRARTGAQSEWECHVETEWIQS